MSRPFSAAVAFVAVFTASCTNSSEPLRAVALAIATQPPSAAQSGVTFASAPVAELRDRNDAVFAQAGVAVTASIASGGGTLGGTTTQITDAQGRATFPDLVISGSVGPRTLFFTANGLAGVSSVAVVLG